jgi:hypothetical protein
MKKLLLISITILTLPAIVHAAGIQASPSSINLRISNSTAEQRIVIANPTADVQVFEIYADDFSSVMHFTPSSFTLEAGDRKNIQLTIDGSKLPSNSTISTTLSIVGKPLADSRFQVGTGIKIPITASTDSSAQPKVPHQRWLILLGLTAGISTGLWYVRRQFN